MLRLVDALGRRLELDAAPRRVVCLAPYLTDTLIQLGAGDRLVGVSDYCPIPPAPEPCEPLGTVQAPDVQRVRELAPDLVLACAQRTPRASLDALAAAGIRVFSLSACDCQGAARLVLSMATLLGIPRTGQERVAEARSRMEEVERRVRGLTPPGVLYLVWRDPFHTAGRHTYVHDLIERAGGRNLGARSAMDHPRTDWEEIAEWNPGVVLLPDHPYNFSPMDVDEFFLRVGCGATLDGRVHIVPGHLLQWPGLRFADALEMLASLLHG